MHLSHTYSLGGNLVEVITHGKRERFSWLVKSIEKIRNRLVIFLEIKEQKSYDITEKHVFPSKNDSFRTNSDFKGENSSK